MLIVSGSPIIGSFDFKTRVDFVRVPGIIKLRSGDYVPLGAHGPVESTTALRASLIRETALSFAPDLFIVDKEPLGLRGELEETLSDLKARGTRLVLGLRDVLDEPRALAAEWTRKNAVAAVESFSMRSPLSSIEPLVTSPRSPASRLLTARSVVVLPAPLPPSSATTEPSGPCRDTPLSTRITWL